jgi:hypothetical protein
MDFFYDETFGWCFVLGEIVLIFVIFMVLHRHALRHHEELTRNEEPSGDDTDSTPT